MSQIELAPGFEHEDYSHPRLLRLATCDEKWWPNLSANGSVIQSKSVGDAVMKSPTYVIITYKCDKLSRNLREDMCMPGVFAEYGNFEQYM